MESERDKAREGRDVEVDEFVITCSLEKSHSPRRREKGGFGFAVLRIFKWSNNT